MPGEDHSELLAVRPPLQPRQSIDLKSRMVYSHTVENERFCPGVIADEVHPPSSTIPFSIPVVVYVLEGRLGIFEFNGDGIVDRSEAQIEAIEV